MNKTITKHKILIGVTGSISIYKMLDIIRFLQRYGIESQVIMTQGATKLISPTLFSGISGNKTLHSMDEDIFPHITHARHNKLLLIAPATCNVIGKIASGIANDLLTCIATTFQGPKIIAPAMNPSMYQNFVTQRNLKILQQSGFQIQEPEQGQVACGEWGQGKLAQANAIQNSVLSSLGIATASPCLKNEVPLELYQQALQHASFKGKNIVVTAGSSLEPWDAVRYLRNTATGRTGMKLARLAKIMGARVTLMLGKTHKLSETELQEISEIKFFSSTNNLLQQLKQEMPHLDMLIMNAAPSNYAPANPVHNKLKFEHSTIMLKLLRTEDILKSLLPLKSKNQIFVGFALESNNLHEYALKKLQDKQLDCIFANPIQNQYERWKEGTLIFSDGTKNIFAPMEPWHMCFKLLRLIAQIKKNTLKKNPKPKQ